MDERDRQKIRHRKLLRLLHDRDRTAFPSERAYAEALGLNAAHLSQMKSRHRTIGNDVADQIEDRLALPRGWLDSDDSPLGPQEQHLLAIWESLPEEARRELGDFSEFLRLKYLGGAGGAAAETADFAPAPAPIEAVVPRRRR